MKKGIELSLEEELEQCWDTYQDLGRVMSKELDKREEWIKEAISILDFYGVDSKVAKDLIKRGQKYLKKGLK